MKTAAERSEKKGNIILRYNAESFSDINQLISQIVKDSANSLEGKIEKVGKSVKKYFSALKPEVSFSMSQTSWKIGLGISDNLSSESKFEFLVEALNGLEKLAAELAPEKKVALMIDEFQEVINQGGKASEKQLRSAIQTHKHTGYIFAGSQTRMLTEMITDPSRPFYRLGKMLFIGKLPRPEFARFLRDKFSREGFISPKTNEEKEIEIIDLILDLAEDVPYNVQMLAHTIWDKLAQMKIGEPEKAFISKEIIRAELNTIVRQTDPFYTQVWNKLTQIQKKALKAVVEENGQELQSKRVARKTNVTPSSMRRGLESLVGQDVLRQKESRGDLKFVFEDPFFSHWINLFIK